MLGYSLQRTPAPEWVAAIDLGSNSFHMIVARVADGQLQVIDRLREMVRLGAGLDADKRLTESACTRAMECLERFGQRVRDMPPGSVRAVGTNTLRQARNGGAFLNTAERALGHPIEIISGREEARLVYLGVAHGLAAGDEPRMVVDIGGGSTEVIVGTGFDADQRESLHMGCVSMSRLYFPDGVITADAMNHALVAGQLELRPIKAAVRASGWRSAVGSSGTIRAIRSVVTAAGWSESGITLQSLKKLRKALISAGHTDNLQLEKLSSERRPVFPGGVAVLYSVFRALEIEHMEVSDEALREGLLYEMLGRFRHEDIRERSIQSLASRYGVDPEQARRVRTSAMDFLGQTIDAWQLGEREYPELLGWAAGLHEIGLAVSHSQFQKHGAYLAANADLSGFSRQEQAVVSALILGHRRKFPVAAFEALPSEIQTPAKRLCILLRLAVLMHRSRSDARVPDMRLKADGARLRVKFRKDWLERHPLTLAELREEAGRLKAAGFKLKFR
jgi:exopolyphosphatase/guanosine-5'-triphosphate,3'-diphosphate pyrophosphatase